MLRPFLMFASLAFFAFSAPVQTPPPSGAPAAAPAPAVPADAAQTPNPVKPTAESQARAKQIYGYDCALCHGEKGDGKGDVAADMKTPMGDFTSSATLKSMTDGELYYVILKGKGQMPPEEGRAKPAEIWNLVIYLRSMSKQ
ncbi:c-type cytochrome [Paracidobacterium acidisoli]|uniref:Cytochrome c n=1 Tax=Paracidobacterium acidisoli TaxID=2303751 RepID=A0A372IMF2_9BACT|nr:cytochrome c [Paracidobacterium acidisoli]MBT9331765.1 cytochrome c [Paracidobacterium acidisoli]